ncbi:YopX family protein [Brevibacillus laterosporus]|uniref:YopX family protein n=1 Tax=Brevibacillus halotolerans TaxID=1507437 RepID=A0ABT4I4K6_9BACL|nr:MULTISPECIES: YopX family protein [Brevibacillus]MCR8987907.1 YopX family protein [Brevibacillus laterosporus]MCZ0833646.1 YopX family protein [Brevibacillus halotolerans]
MREIKFQLWDEIRKQMWTWEQLIALESNTGRKQFLYQAIVGPPKKRILRIYTGLKDCNGKEIYEGDIIQFDGYVKAIVYVEYHDKLGVYQAKNSNSRWLLAKESGIYQKVIGNIYENPELLGV